MDHRSWDERYSAKELIWRAAPNQFLVAEVTGMIPGHALDLGCGEGRNAVWLAEQGWKVTAVDFSSVGIEKGKEMSARRGVEVEWVLHDLLTYEPAKQEFDLVIDFYIHLEPMERMAVLAKAALAVAPGGTALVVGHDLTNLEEGCGGPQDPDRLHTPVAIAAGLDGLSIVKADRVQRNVDVDGETFIAIDSLVRARRP